MNKITIQAGALQRKPAVTGLHTCQDCGGPVSVRASACPKCGAPQAGSKLSEAQARGLGQQILATNIAVIVLLPLVIAGLVSPRWAVVGLGALAWNIIARAYRGHRRA